MGVNTDVSGIARSLYANCADGQVLVKDGATGSVRAEDKGGSGGAGATDGVVIGAVTLYFANGLYYGTGPSGSPTTDDVVVGSVTLQFVNGLYTGAT